MKSKISLVCFLWGLLQVATTFGQAQNAYLKNLNSRLPGTPEAGQIMKYIDFPVNLFTGSPTVEIPLYTLNAMGISVPVSLSYNAGGGVKVNELAGECGLSWALSCGGEITRETRGAPDEGGGDGFALGVFNNPHPINWYAGQISNFDAQQTFEYASKGQLDLEPDIFYFRFGNKSGKFVYNTETSQFDCTVQQPLKISFTGNVANSAFTIISDDGTTYYFNYRVTSRSRNDCGQATIPTLSQPVTTSWKLSKIINADKTDSIMFEYGLGTYHYYSEGTSQIFHVLGGATPPGGRPPVNCYNYTELSGFTYLNRIYSLTDTVILERQQSDRLDVGPGAYALSRLKVKSSNGLFKHIYAFNTDYITRNTFYGVTPEQSYNSKSLRLLSLTDFGNSESNPNPPKWTFTYNTQALPGRLSYQQDYWGYKNDNDQNTLVPATILINGLGNPQSVPGANRMPQPSKMQAGILTSVTFPTGGTTTFEYEPNTTHSPTPYSSTAASLINRTLSDFKGPNSLFSTAANAYTLTFNISQPPDPAINLNSPNGGVFADIYVDPGIPGWQYGDAVQASGVQFQLSGPGAGMTLQGNMQHILLDSGTYTMKIVNLAPLNTPDMLQLPRSVAFNISYKQYDTTQASINYNCGGVRIKSTSTTDQYSGATIVKQYFYHDPVTDTSYGQYVSPGFNTYVDNVLAEVGQNEPTPPGTYAFPFLVRNGNSIMPGNNYAGAAVIYPKVIEQVLDGDKKYRTEHIFTFSAPYIDNGYPYVAPEYDEAGAGKQKAVIVYKDLGNNSYSPVQINKSTYTTSHPGNPLLGYVKSIEGVKCVSTGYAQGISDLNAQFLLRPAVKAYNTKSNYWYMVADTAITYDMTTGAPVSQYHQYVYGEYNQQPVSITTNNSDGSTSVQQNWYASDGPGTSTEVNTTVTAQMMSANRVTEVLGTKQFRNGGLTDQQFFYNHFSGSKLLTDSLKTAILSNPLDKEVEVLSYDIKGNPLTIKMRGNKYRKYQYRDEQNITTASCLMAQDGAFVFSSFEYPNEAGSTPSGWDNSGAFSGMYSYRLNAGNLALTGFNSPSGLDVYVWVNGGLSSPTGGPVSANGVPLVPTGRMKGVWSLNKVTLPASTTSVTLSVNQSAQIYIDQLAIVPTGSDFEGNVYDGQQRIVAKVNGNMQTAFFEYDNFGRLVTIKDEQGNIVKQNAYQYQGAQ